MALFRSIRERMCTSMITGMSPGRPPTAQRKRSVVGLVSTLATALGLVTVLGCEDPPAPPMAAPTSVSSAGPTAKTTSSASAAPTASGPRPLTPPSEDELAKLDVHGACVAVCQAQVTCTVSDEVARDAAALTERQKRCGQSCRRTKPPKETQAQYLDHARRCLHATDCAMFGGCAFGTQTVNQ
jgi:hypothetical protein